MARDGPTMKVSTNYEQVNRNPMYRVKTASLSVESEVDTSYLQGMSPTTHNRNRIIPVHQKILNAVDITINWHKAHILIDRYTINGDLISANLCFRNKIPTEDMDAKPLETAIKGSRSTMIKKRTVERNIQGNKIRRTFHVSNFGDWDVIAGQAFLTTLNVIMDAKNNKVYIQLTGKPRQQLHMLQKQSHAVSITACSIDD